MGIRGRSNYNTSAQNTLTTSGSDVYLNSCHVRIAVNRSTRYVRIGCTQISFAAMERLHEIFEKYRQPMSDETVVQP